MTPSLIKISNLSLKYDGSIDVLKSIDLEINEGEIICVLGPSGCGKTSLLRSLAGFERPYSGEISIAGKTVFSNKTSIAPEKRGIGFVFQDLALFPHLTVSENIKFGLKSRPKKEHDDICREMLTLTGIEEHGHKYPHELSGGQKQRVAIARSVAPHPRVILMDEPFSSLDEDLADELYDEFSKLIKRIGLTAIIVTHAQKQAFSISDRCLVLNNGNIEAFSDAKTLYEKPSNEFLANFFGEGTFIDSGIFKEKESKQQKIFVRPESIEVFTEEGEDTIEVKVEESRYLGGRYINTAFISKENAIKFYSKTQLSKFHVRLS